MTTLQLALSSSASSSYSLFLSPFSKRNPLNSLLFYKRRRRLPLSHSHYHFTPHFLRPRLLYVAAASENGAYNNTSPEIAKSFDFASEERIYTWYSFIPCSSFE
ncbi:hypothetical protein PIB30_052029 [Stylosanthes scabra]|uniref:Uncharacterized protein n=1 Tax=Stylosanthes scabra TaxID=79078 RepID=A0ABU6ZGV5_9FABA|nr:hypothetical protein [Stylosanthes scabra]